MPESNKPGEMNTAHRSSLEPQQLGKVPRPTGRPQFHLEASRSNNFAIHFARRGSSEIYSQAVDIAGGREIKANIDTPF